MLKLSCNGTDRVHCFSQCGLARPASVFPRRSSTSTTVGFRSPATRATPVLAVVSDRDGAVVNRFEPDSGTLADRLRLGRLTEDGLSYKEKFIVRSYEVGINKTATVETIANLLQFKMIGVRTSIWIPIVVKVTNAGNCGRCGYNCCHDAILETT